MKQSFARQPSHHRNRTPSVICLPPPKPPVAVKRAEPVVPEPEAAMTLPEAPEPLVTERVVTARAEVHTPQPQSLNRQARRKALRAEAKAMRRQGHAPAPIAQPAPPPLPSTPEPAPQAVLELDTIAPPPAEPAAEVPLPPSRALVAARPRGLAGLAHRLRVMIGLTRSDAMPAGPGAITGQLRTLRKELAALQQSVDRILDGVAG